MVEGGVGNGAAGEECAVAVAQDGEEVGEEVVAPFEVEGCDVAAFGGAAAVYTQGEGCGGEGGRMRRREARRRRVNSRAKGREEEEEEAWWGWR